MAGKNDAQSMNADDMLSGGEERKPVLFWKGDNVGDYLIGSIVAFSSFKNKEGADVQTAIMAPAATFSKLDGKWTYQREAQLTLGASLSQRISHRADRGKVFSVRFDGTAPSQKEGHSDARLYTVAEQTREKLTKILGMSEA